MNDSFLIHNYLGDGGPPMVSYPANIPSSNQRLQRFPCFWGLLDGNLDFMAVSPSFVNDELNLVGTNFLSRAPPDNATQLKAIIKESLDEKSLHGFYIR